MSERASLELWLKKYNNPKTAYNDIVVVLNSYKNLHSFQETYNFSDGTSKELVNLTGTIPVQYRGSMHNILICIWILDTYPTTGPICYVKPYADINIKVSTGVDQNGKIYLPYLHDWVASGSNLIDLLQVMIVTFAETFPLSYKMNDSQAADSSNSAIAPKLGFKTPYPQPTYLLANHFPLYSPPSSSLVPICVGSKSEVRNTNEGTGTIKYEHIKQSLLTAIEEKLMKKINEKVNQSLDELATLKKTQEELKRGKVKLDNILIKLQKEQNDLCINIALLKNKKNELDKSIEKINNVEGSVIDVDDVVITDAPLYQQLVNAFAEEAALEDTIYYLGEGLRKGVIDLETFLKQVRTLSRKQFMLRALMQKCRQKAGLLE